MNYATEIYIDSDRQELTKTTWEDGGVCYKNKNGKRHRLDGPASIWSDGTEVWFKDGLEHRLDGPACSWSDGEEEYYLEGKEYSKEEYFKKIGKS